MTASAGEKRILIWDGLSFTCERQLEDISIGHLGLAENCLVITSFKAPFMRLWGVPHEGRRVWRGERTRQYRSLGGDKSAEAEDVVAMRSPVWTYAMLKGGSLVENKATMVPPYLSGDYMQVDES